MPFWMSGSALLNLLLVLPFEHPKSSVWRIDAIALTIQIVAVLFSLIALVPINTRIARWVQLLFLAIGMLKSIYGMSTIGSGRPD